MVMTDEEFRRIFAYLKSRYGIDMSRKKEIVNGRLENYIHTGGWASYGAFMDVLEQDASGAMEKKLVDLLTTNHTFFMREFEHFDYLKAEVLPYLKEKEKNRRDLCIWCGAASTGEEPYTLAMLLQEFFALEAGKWDTKVLATDVSTEALEKAIRGEYGSEQIKALPDKWKRRYFRPVAGSDSYMVTEELKQEVLFRKFNLMEPFPFKRKMHIVFMRNVMIYFDVATKRQLVQKIYDVMEPGGYLFIGRTETIDRSVAPFEMIQPSIFRKKEGL